MGSRSVVLVVLVLTFLCLWSTAVHASFCDNCTNRKCTILCGSMPGKRSGVTNQEDTNGLHIQSKAPIAKKWLSREQCTLDAWFEELPLEWQNEIIGLFQVASTYADPS